MINKKFYQSRETILPFSCCCVLLCFDQNPDSTWEDKSIHSELSHGATFLDMFCYISGVRAISGKRQN